MFNPFESTFHEDRYSRYRVCRESAPLHWGAPAVPGIEGSWYVFSYDSVTALLNDSRLGKESPSIDINKRRSSITVRESALWELIKPWMLLVDEPAHGEYRGIFKDAFKTHFNEVFQSRISEIALQLSSELPRGETVDIISAFAVPYTVRVISELLGIPSSLDHDIRRWSQALFLAVDLKQDSSKYGPGVDAAQAVRNFLLDLIKHKRRQPANDLISTVLCSDEGKKLQDNQLVANFSFLLFAGHETAIGLIGNGLQVLLDHPEQLALLRKNQSLYPSVIDEILRFESPVQLTTRFALEDLEACGNQIRKGDLICLMFGAANRDPDQFADPERFDITRCPNRHLGFGYGPHFCLGAMMGRLEGRVGVQALIDSTVKMESKLETLQWFDSVTIRTLLKMPIILS